MTHGLQVNNANQIRNNQASKIDSDDKGVLRAKIGTFV